MGERGRRAGVSSAVVFAVASVVGAAPSGDTSGASRTESLAGARVHLTASRPQLPAVLGSSDALLDEASRRLREGALPMIDELAFMSSREREDVVDLQLDLRVEEPCGDRAHYSIEVRAVQRVRLARNPVLTFQATTWSWGRSGSVATSPAVGAQTFLRDLVSFAVQRFVTDYRKVN